MSILQSIGQSLLIELRSCSAIDSINRLLLRFGSQLGAEFFQLTPGPANPFDDLEFLAQFGNFPKELNRYYYLDELLSTDPSYFAALQHSSAIKWRDALLKNRTQAQREYLERLKGFGISDGISIPIHGPNGCIAVLIFASTRLLGKAWDDSDYLSLFAVALIQRIKRIMAARLLPQEKEVTLTVREAECLAWVLDGKTNWEIGVLVGITARTVQFHIANCTRKFGVNNRIQAAVKALTGGMISLPDVAQNTRLRQSLASVEFTTNCNIICWPQAQETAIEKNHF